jgi:hypothetical protein
MYSWSDTLYIGIRWRSFALDSVSALAFAAPKRARVERAMAIRLMHGIGRGRG